MSNPSAGGEPLEIAKPLGDRYFHDYPQGAVFVGGSEVVTRKAIIDFARSFDPQRIHSDSDFAEGGPFRGLIASGFHTLAISMRMSVRYYLNEAASLASPGADEIRWPAPVRPGDVLSANFVVESARPSSSKPDRGIIQTRITLCNERQETVLTMRMLNILRKWPTLGEEKATPSLRD